LKSNSKQHPNIEIKRLGTATKKSSSGMNPQQLSVQANIIPARQAVTEQDWS